jgi:hypothetical protein
MNKMRNSLLRQTKEINLESEVEKTTEPIEVLSENRLKALESRNYPRYSAICDFIGLCDINNSNEYLIGKKDLGYKIEAEKIVRLYSKLVKNAREREFYRKLVLKDEFHLETESEDNIFTKYVPTSRRQLIKELNRVCNLLDLETPKNLHRLNVAILRTNYLRIRKTYYVRN